MNRAITPEPDWKWGTAEGSREFDRRLDRMLSFREIVQWLEEAETLTIRMHRSGSEFEASGKNQGT